jgi:hypothetical protein
MPKSSNAKARAKALAEQVVNLLGKDLPPTTHSNSLDQASSTGKCCAL